MSCILVVAVEWMKSIQCPRSGLELCGKVELMLS
jgi:hypothetical protein